MNTKKLVISIYKRIWFLATILFVLLYATAGSLINIHRLRQYDLGYYDFGFFAVSIWKVSRFQLPITDHFVFANKIIFADHFNPSIFLLSPLMWFTSNFEILLIAQSIMVSASGLVLYFISNKILKSSFLSFSIVVAYFLFTGLQNAVYSDFHELTVMTLFLVLTYWSIITNHKKLFILFFIITLGFKESLFLLGFGISIFIFFYKKEWRKLSVITGLASIIWGGVVIKLIIGYFSKGKYNSQPDLSGGIGMIIMRLFTPIIKIKTVFWILTSFLFLPIITPSLLPILILNFVHRFLNPASTRWDLGLHYNAEIAPTLALASILSLSFLQKKINHFMIRLIGIILIVCSLFLYRIVFHGPMGLSYNKAFYDHTKDFKFLDDLVNKVPSRGRISAQNNLTPAFFERDIFILRDIYTYMDPDYIVLDSHDGQNPNNYLGVNDIKSLKEKIKKDNKYTLFYQNGDQYIFKKKSIK